MIFYTFVVVRTSTCSRISWGFGANRTWCALQVGVWWTNMHRTVKNGYAILYFVTEVKEFCQLPSSNQSYPHLKTNWSQYISMGHYHRAESSWTCFRSMIVLCNEESDYSGSFEPAYQTLFC